MPKDWHAVRYDLDSSDNFSDIANSPWYSDAVYDSFSDAEYARRHALARSLMERDGFDALILTGSQNVYSLGSGVTWGSGLIDDRGMCQYMVLPLDGEPTLIYPHPGCHIEAVRRMVGLSDVRGSQGGHYGKAIADRLKELGLAAGRIGVTAADTNGPEFMGAAAYLELRDCVPDADVVFCPDLFHELTVRKGPEEIDAMRRGGELAIASQEAVTRAAVPGIHEYELAAVGTAAILAGGGRVHLMMIASTAMDDPRIMYPNPNPSARVLREGDIILTEIAAAHLGYSAKIGHPVTIGEPTADAKRFHEEVTLPGFNAIESVLVPGTDLTEVQKAGEAFRKAGGQSRPMVLHGIDLITAGPKVMVHGVSAKDYEKQLMPGMVVNVEATPISRDGSFGSFLSRTYAITEDGAEALTPYPTEDIVVGG
jgi:Xaa-Pro aminopeptidase